MDKMDKPAYQEEGGLSLLVLSLSLVLIFLILLFCFGSHLFLLPVNRVLYVDQRVVHVVTLFLLLAFNGM